MDQQPCEHADVVQLMRAHSQRYPAMQTADAFKLLQQSIVGSEHAVADTSSVLNWMRREWESLGDGPEEPLVDTLGLNSPYARVHLRTFAKHGGDPSQLVDAFIKTGREHRGDTTTLSCAVQTLVDAAHRGELPWPGDSICAFGRQWKAQGYPAVSHSTQYRTAYKPAYRVVALPLVRKLLPPAR